MSDKRHVRFVEEPPSLRARLLGILISRFTNVSKIDLHNYRHHRDSLEKLAKGFPKLKKSATCISVSLEGFDGEWIVPAGVALNKVLYYLHGGGFAICSVNTHRSMITALAEEIGVKSFAINYRLAPEYQFPAALEDSVAGYEYILSKKIAPHDIIVAGDSAGGGLAIAMMLRLRERGMPLPCAAACISPWVDLEASGMSHIDNAASEKLLDRDSVIRWGKVYAGGENVRHPMVSPVYADLSGLPPLFIQVSNSEILMDDALKLHEKALYCKVDSTLEIWNGLSHVWQIHTFLPESKRALNNIARFAHRHLSLT